MKTFEALSIQENEINQQYLIPQPQAEIIQFDNNRLRTWLVEEKKKKRLKEHRISLGIIAAPSTSCQSP